MQLITEAFTAVYILFTTIYTAPASLAYSFAHITITDFKSAAGQKYICIDQPLVSANY
jgi:hypothetical protein